MKSSFFNGLFILLLASGCSVIRQSPKYDFADGIYVSKVLGKDRAKVYVDNAEEIYVYPLRKTTGGYLVDSSTKKPIIFTKTKLDSMWANPSFRQNSFDIDFLTIPFKYRFSVNGFPRQFNANLNGAIYLGYRSDIYVLHYATNVLHSPTRHTTHIGFSFGTFSGLGGTAINPSVTNNLLTIEYDGLVWSKGVSGIIALNNFTMGLAFGWDHLLDDNKSKWLYHNKSWIGFVFGLNIN